MSNDLNEAKQRLLEKLGPNYDIYIQLLGKWFRGLISKEEFDKSAKQLIEQSFVLEHNKFWLGFFHHCANSATSNSQAHSLQMNNSLNCYNQTSYGQHYGEQQQILTSDSIACNATTNSITNKNGIIHKCLPNKIITHMKVFVIAWEMGLDSADDQVSVYISLAVRHFLKNIITELITTKTAYRLRENRFKYAIGVKPINPYLNNSLKIYSSNFEYDPYQIESNKMNSSLVDTYAYNDSLFPSRLYEAQALYEYACSTTSVTPNSELSHKTRCIKRLKLGVDKSDVNINESDDVATEDNPDKDSNDKTSEHRLTLFHMLVAFLSNKSIMPQNLYSINIERIFTKLSR